MVEFDRWKRYLLPDPITSHMKPWTRVTTLSATISDRYMLEQWEKRSVAVGLSRRPDLVELAASCDPDDSEDKKTLNKIAKQAIEASGSSRGANMGTAFHKFVEKMDSGKPLGKVRGETASALKAYIDILSRKGLVIRPEYSERIILNHKAGVAGRLDRLANYLNNEELYVADVKTQKSLDFGTLQIGAQLALYASAEYIWDEKREEWETIPPINQETAFVVWVPIGQNVAEVRRVDLKVGGIISQISQEVRKLRKTGVLFDDVPDCPDFLIQRIMHAKTVEDVKKIGNQAIFLYGSMPSNILTAGKSRIAELQEKEVIA